MAELAWQMGELIPQDFSAGDLFSDKEKLKPYCDILREISRLEQKVLKIIG